MKRHYGRRVAARRFAHCFECGEETVQWLSHLKRSSLGAARGAKTVKHYTCSRCGEVNLE